MEPVLANEGASAPESAASLTVAELPVVKGNPADQARTMKISGSSYTVDSTGDSISVTRPKPPETKRFSGLLPLKRKPQRGQVGSSLSKKLGNKIMTPERRCEEFPNNSLRAVEGTHLFCDACSVPLDWQRRSTVLDHCRKSKRHAQNVEAMNFSVPGLLPLKRKPMAGQVGSCIAKKLGNNIMTPERRCDEFPNNYLRAVEGTHLFCDACLVPLDWQRKSTLVDHCEKSKKHAKNVEAIQCGEKPNPLKTPSPKKISRKNDSEDSSDETMTPQKRVEEFPGNFLRASGMTLLFCDACMVPLDWQTRKSMAYHCEKSKKHQKNIEAILSETESGPPLIQISPETISSKVVRNEFAIDFVNIVLSAGLSLEVFENFKPFLLKYCESTGTIPSNAARQGTHLSQAFEEHVRALKSRIKDKKVCVVLDESSELTDRVVLNIIFVIDGNRYLVATEFLKKSNHQTISRSVKNCLQSYQVTSGNVIGFVTDSAAYTLKACQEVLLPMCPNAVHCCCLVHIISLVGECWEHAEEFRELSDFISLFRSVFYKRGARKRRFEIHLASSGQSTSLAPALTGTGWKAWFSAAKFHVQHFDHYMEFFSTEQNVSSTFAIGKLVYLLTEKMQDLKIQGQFVGFTCCKIMDTLLHFETAGQLACSAMNWIEDLQSFLSHGPGNVMYSDDFHNLLHSLRPNIKQLYINNFHSIFLSAASKFSMHVDRLPAARFLREVRVFDPVQAKCMSQVLSEYSSLSMTEDAAQRESLETDWNQYHREVQESLHTYTDLGEFWTGLESRLPTLAKMATTLINIPLIACNAEDSFSIYRDSLIERKETQEHVRMMVMMNFNSSITRNLFQPKQS